ncbi:MAG: hypothetical protein ACTS3F_03835 [Phycisphaerales bacterium]
MSISNARTAACSAAAVLALAANALAGITTTDPGLYESIDDRFEARMRLDGGNSQTWKTAFWDDAMIANSGIAQNVFQNGITYPFSFTYNAGTGDAFLSIAGRNLSQNIPLTPGLAFAGFDWFVRSEINASTTASNLAVSIDAGTPIAIPGLVSDNTQVFVAGPTYFLDAPATTIAITGDLTFAWTQGVNLNNERFKLSFKINEGTLVPTPSALAAFALAGLTAARRRRNA